MSNIADKIGFMSVIAQIIVFVFIFKYLNQMSIVILFFGFIFTQALVVMATYLLEKKIEGKR